jgi:hypothetical protein
MSLKLYRPTRTGLEPSPVAQKNWRRRLRSPRWRPAALENPVGIETSPLLGMLFFAGLAALTFVLLIGGYATGVWGP